MTIKVLIADDQFPSEREEENESTRQELIRIKGDELKARGRDPNDAVREDREWFSGLKEYLEEKLQYEVVPAYHFQDAVNLIGGRSMPSTSQCSIFLGLGTQPWAQSLATMPG